MYHLYVSAMSKDCGLGFWKYNSVIQHATSMNAEGPYEFEQELFPAFSHNPTITRAPDGTYLLYHIGQAIPKEEVPLYVKDCRMAGAARKSEKPARFSARTGPAEYDD